MPIHEIRPKNRRIHPNLWLFQMGKAMVNHQIWGCNGTSVPKIMVKLGSWDLLHQGIDLLNGGILLSSEGQVHHGDVRGWARLGNRLVINEAMGCREGNGCCVQNRWIYTIFIGMVISLLGFWGTVPYFPDKPVLSHCEAMDSWLGQGLGAVWEFDRNQSIFGYDSGSRRTQNEKMVIWTKVSCPENIL